MAERIAWVTAVVLVGTAAFFVGQEIGGQSATQRRAQASQQFFAERGGQGAGMAQGVGAPQGAPGFPGGGQGVMGTVERVEGDQLIITTLDGTSVTVKLADGGTVRKQVEGQLSDAQPGERVVAMGERSGDTVEASTLQIGGGFGGARPGQ